LFWGRENGKKAQGKMDVSGGKWYKKTVAPHISEMAVLKPSFHIFSGVVHD
jgi:hypothetical protein